MEKLSSQKKDKKILFLISLPSTPEFLEMSGEVEECLHLLRVQGVDVREHIRREDLAGISGYDVVIIVAHSHPDHPAFVLADGELTFHDFIDSLPSDFKGILDISSCYSQKMAADIKEKCPDCKVQVALFTVPLLPRVLIYPAIAEELNHGSSPDYSIAYKNVTKDFKMILKDVPDELTTDEEMVHLGKKVTSIYAPCQVVRNVSFQIIVYLYYDSEKRAVIADVRQRINENGKERKQVEIPVDLEKGDMVSVTLSFFDDFITILNGDKTRSVKLQKEITVEPFVVKVLPDFQGDYFNANVAMSKDDNTFLSYPFCINVGDKVDAVPADIDAESLNSPDELKARYQRYEKICSSIFLGNDLNSRFQIIKHENITVAEKLDKIRNFIFLNDSYFKKIQDYLLKTTDSLTQIQKKDRLSEINLRLVPEIKKFLDKEMKSVAKVEGRFYTIKGRTLSEATPGFSSFESDFFDCVDNVMDLSYQTKILLVFLNFKEQLEKQRKEQKPDADVMKKIKDAATNFYRIILERGTDESLLQIFKDGSGSNSIIHSRSKGVTVPFLALAIAMAYGEYISIDNGKDGWTVNVTDCMDLHENKDMRVPKVKINKLFCFLRRDIVMKKIKKFHCPKENKISVLAYLIQHIKLTIQ